MDDFIDHAAVNVPRKSKQERLRVLVIAEAANPEWASVPLIGWSLARALREEADVMVVTHVRNRSAIQRAGWTEGRDFVCIDNEYIARRIHKLGAWLGARNNKGWTIGAALAPIAYYEFERLVWRRFKAELLGGQFDVVHRITPLSPVVPSTLATRCRSAGIPFVLGPLNGGVPWPKEFLGAMRAEREWLSLFRGASRWLPGYRSTRHHATAVLVGSQDTLRLEPMWSRGKCIYLPENAVDPARFNRALTQNWSDSILRACFVGRLVPYKGADMALEALMPLVKDGLVIFDIVGDGPERGRLEAMAQGLSGVRFHGWLPHEAVQDVLSAAHVLVFPSVREFGGGVVLEAMALGVVPIVADYAGPGELVSSETGYKVPMAERSQLVASLHALLKELSAPQSRADLKARAVAARSRVESKFTWPARAKMILEIYRWALSSVGMKKPNVMD